MILYIVIVCGILASSRTAMAQDDPPTVEWTDSSRLALGQCFVAEARWRNRTEHAAMAHVLVRRWRHYLAAHRGSDYTFEQMVRQYCAVHRAPEPTPHQLWVRALPWGTMVVNPGMDPEQTDWRNWVDDWDYVRETVALFEAGALRDPLPGAMHWGSTDDGNPHHGIPMPRVIASIVDDTAVALHNHFYALDQGRLRCYRAVMIGPVQVFTADHCQG